VIATRSKSACLHRRGTIGMRQLLIASSTAARRWHAAHLIATMVFSRTDSVKATTSGVGRLSEIMSSAAFEASWTPNIQIAHPDVRRPAIRYKKNWNSNEIER
jgi:hypothetical protein